MIFPKQLAAACGVFGLAVIASGVIRMLTDVKGQNGLYFGLVMGGIALAAAALAAMRQILAARIVASFAIAVVVLWFGNDLSKNFSFGEAGIRKMILIVLGVALAVILALPIRATAPVKDAA